MSATWGDDVGIDWTNAPASIKEQYALVRLFWFFRMIDSGGPDGSAMDSEVYDEAMTSFNIDQWLSGESDAAEIQAALDARANGAVVTGTAEFQCALLDALREARTQSTYFAFVEAREAAGRLETALRAIVERTAALPPDAFRQVKREVDAARALLAKESR